MTPRDEAARWFATLRRGVLTLEERSAYEVWAKQRANRAALAQMEQIWSALGHVQRPVPSPHIARKMLLAALCAASLGALVLAYSGDSSFFTHLDWANR